ncbi:MAG: hypothetical protein DRG78_09470 [Epsilonproteobacteria bacterium]|nr:MAG: hypothetical protein DRG78_09470 [Campylobacterota bacterium]
MNYKIIFILLIGSVSFMFANNIKSTTKEAYGAGYRINIDALINDKKDIIDARVYFKSSKNEPYQYFSKMKCKGKLCRGVLPIPKMSTHNILYKIIYKNGIGKVYEGKEYLMYEKEILVLQSNQTKDRKYQTIYTDLQKSTGSIRGFTGNYGIKTVPKSDRLGVLAGFVSPQNANISDKSDEIDARYHGWAAEALPAGVVGAIILLLMFF